MRHDAVVSEQGFDITGVLEGARDAITVRRVFGDPYEKNGVTVIPAAALGGGGGGGGGDEGSGGGFGLTARPVGAYVIRDGRVVWEPAVDWNKVILGAQVVVVVLALAAVSINRIWARASGRRRR
jgi:uncharacterized spore protein YtfJ